MTRQADRADRPSREFRYAACYCEENIWQLARDRGFAGRECCVALVTGKGPYRRLWHQKNAPNPQTPVLWDYHVILLVREEIWRVWDLDTTLGLPVSADTYFRQTFLHGNIEPGHTDVFLRLIPADFYTRHFSSDRAHMVSASGRWSAPPPPWAPILEGGKPNLLEWLNIERDRPGSLLSLEAFLTLLPDLDPGAISD